MSVISKSKRWATRWLGVGSLGVISAILLASCAGDDPTATPTPSPTATSRPGPVASPTPTSTRVPTPTNTPVLRDFGVKRGGSLTSAERRDPPSFDPHVASGAIDLFYISQLYSGLLWNKRGAELLCDLCETWKLENSGLTHVFGLRDNATFADGTPVRAKDVIYSLRKMTGEIADHAASPKCGTLGKYFRANEPFEAPDELTVKINLAAPAPAFPKFLAMNFCGIVKKGATSDELKTESMGSGAFVVKKWDTGSEVVYEARTNWWKDGLPYLDEFVVSIVPDTTARSSAVLTGRIDRTRVSGSPDFRTQYDQFVKDGKGEFIDEPLMAVWGFGLNTSQPPLDNKMLRHAINLALDREDENQSVKNGFGVASLYQPRLWPGARKPADIWDKIPGWGTGANKQAEIEQAKQLVIDAGYPNGIDLKILTGIGGQAEWLTTQLPRAGMTGTIVKEDRAPLFQRYYDLDYELFSWALITGFPEPDQWIATFFLTGGSFNFMGFSDPNVDRLFIEQSKELDAQKRIQLATQVEDIVLEAMPWVPLADSASSYLQWWYVDGYDNGLGEFFRDRAEKLYDGRIQ